MTTERTPTMHNYPPVTLPDKASELLDLALADLSAVEQNPACKVNMRSWLTRDYKDTGTPHSYCEVCMAGAVLYQRAELPAGALYVDPSDFDELTRRKLKAINFLRCGEIDTALFYLGRQKPPSLPLEVPVPYYQADGPDVFRASMERLADLLRTAGE